MNIIDALAFAQDPWAFEEIGLPTVDGWEYGAFDGRVEAKGGVIQAIILNTRKRIDGHWRTGSYRIERKDFPQSTIATLLAVQLADHFADELHEQAAKGEPEPFPDERPGGTSAGRSI